MKEIVFAEACFNDIDEVFDMFQHTIERMNQNGIPQWDEVYPWKKELYIGRIDDKIAVAYVLNKEYDSQYENGQWLYSDLNYYVLHRLCVSSDFQNQGIGTRTVCYIEKQVKDMGAEVIRLDAFTLNPHALALYRKLNYKEVGFANFRKGKFILMEKKLQ